MRILLTAFEPFGGETINPTMEALKLLDNEMDGIMIDKLVLPTVFKRSQEVLSNHLENHTYDVVLCLGQAAYRYDITPERVAINIDDARLPDNDNDRPVDKPILKDGPDAYFSNLPIKDMVQRMKENGIPASISNSAGTYVCNHIMYTLMHLIHTKYPKMKGGFMHVPFSNEQVLDKRNAPSLSLETIVKGIKLSIEVINEKTL